MLTRQRFIIARKRTNMVVVDFILEIIGYTTARVLLPIITFGSVQVERVSSKETGFNWAGFKRNESGGFMLQAPMAGWIGLIPWTALFVALFANA
jgi:hypothetical protein